jgi:putative phosphoesterase
MLGEQAILNKKTPDFQVAKTIGLISDTHVPKRAMRIPQRVFEVFANVDYIIHAGDLVHLSVVDELEQIAPVLAVQGNMDSPEVQAAFPKVNSMKMFGWKIGVTHDPSVEGASTLKEAAVQLGFHVFVYGHTHLARIEWAENILFINPGSPTDPVSVMSKPSVALLKVTKETITPQIVEL